MKIGILGPSKPKEWYKLMKIKEKDYLEKIKYIANVIANKNHSIVVVPHKDSLSHIFAQYYIDFNGNKVIGVIPLEDTEFGYDYLDKEICDEIINAGTWRNVPETLDEHSDILFTLNHFVCPISTNTPGPKAKTSNISEFSSNASGTFLHVPALIISSQIS